MESFIDNHTITQNVPSAPEILVIAENNGTEHEANLARNIKLSPEAIHYISLKTDSTTAIQSVEWLSQQML